MVTIYGLTNHDTEDLGVLAMSAKRPKIFMYCTSVKCCTYETQKADGKIIKRQRTMVVKQVNQDNCPDCGCALLARKGIKG